VVILNLFTTDHKPEITKWVEALLPTSSIKVSRHLLYKVFISQLVIYSLLSPISRVVTIIAEQFLK